MQGAEKLDEFTLNVPEHKFSLKGWKAFTKLVTSKLVNVQTFLVSWYNKIYVPVLKSTVSTPLFLPLPIYRPPLLSLPLPPSPSPLPPSLLPFPPLLSPSLLLPPPSFHPPPSTPLLPPPSFLACCFTQTTVFNVE